MGGRSQESQNGLPTQPAEEAASRAFTRTDRAWLLPPAFPVAFVYLTGYKSRSLSWSRVLTIVVR
jgi:hypothetical protein